MAFVSRYVLGLIFGICVSYALGLPHCRAQPEDDELPEFLPGLVGNYRIGEFSATRVDPDLLFDWSRDRPDLRLPKVGRLQAAWSGLLYFKDNGAFQLSVYGSGAITIKLDGASVLTSSSAKAAWHHSEPLDLRVGRKEIEVRVSADGTPKQFKLFWRGPSFDLEPIAANYLSHPSETTPSGQFELGKDLYRALRCAACHSRPHGTSAESLLVAPALTHLQENLRPSWLVQHLRERPVGPRDFSVRRMPYYGFDKNSAAAISAALFQASAASRPAESVAKLLTEAAARREKKQPEIRTDADAHQGAIAFASIGCIACHSPQPADHSPGIQQQLFSGGRLDRVAMKRTTAFFERWLDTPESVNSKHRMPVFDLSLNERHDLNAYLSTLGAEDSRNDTKAWGDAQMGVGLVQRHRCGTCHELPPQLVEQLPQARPLIKLTNQSDWENGCLNAPEPRSGKPGFGLSARHREALREFVVGIASDVHVGTFASQIFAEKNCLACHRRDLAPGNSALLPTIAKDFPETAARLAALSPPALTGVGDKLYKSALGDAVQSKHPPLRPWLDIRMPKFRFGRNEADAIVDYLVGHDRIPEYLRETPPLPGDQASELAAARLVTSEGFGCQSCHQIGNTEAPKVDLKARGTNLAMLGDRIRPSWFQRWVRSPARIVPRMEMPAIQTAAKGVLEEDLDVQLAVLWKTLNTPEFRPPRANPVRVVRNHNLAEAGDEPSVMTCVLEAENQVFLRPLVVGLNNRNNVLFDLQTGQLSAWWIGDTARQHTRGKTWYWEPGSLFLNKDLMLQRVSIVDAQGRRWEPASEQQFAVHMDSVRRFMNNGRPEGIECRGRLEMHLRARSSSSRGTPVSKRQFAFNQLIRPADQSPNSVQIQTTMNVDQGSRIVLESDLTFDEQPDLKIAADISEVAKMEISSAGSMTVQDQHSVVLAVPNGTDKRTWTTTLVASLGPDTLPMLPAVETPLTPKTLDVVPGYEAIQLALPTDEMPISFAWAPAGEMFFGSLKGNVFQLVDQDQDGLADRFERISDSMPTPYGLQASETGLDVLTKFALVRLSKPSGQTSIWDMRIVADGWGYTSDYHDWAVGLERDPQGNYYMALPCQQDERSPAAAYLRGQALKLVPNADSVDANRLYRIEPIAAGLRFPMGIALRSNGDLFTTDNQGNYNPFNELNHLEFGKRYGFINKLENQGGFSPPFESPAINLPHPWTRSVNGICFLETPSDASSKFFGPFEGHLIGCEMNGRALVRMSLEKVGNVIQGAAYNFSRPAADGETTFEGPIVCEVAPNGDLYVGNLQDSGWGGGQNTGSIVRLRPSGEPPVGIAEVRATPTGFLIQMTQPVDRDAAGDSKHYQVRSYRRISTPAYGGDDQNERTEPVIRTEVNQSATEIALTLQPLRAGYVYEITIGSIGAQGESLFPQQAHYTMKVVPGH